MARKFKDGDVVIVKKDARATVISEMDKSELKCFRSTKWFGVVNSYSWDSSTGGYPYEVASGKSGKGVTFFFKPKELELVRRA